MRYIMKAEFPAGAFCDRVEIVRLRPHRSVMLLMLSLPLGQKGGEK